MYFRFLILFLISFLFIGCNLREDDSLPAGVSPFDLVDQAIYINSQGKYPTSSDSLWIKVELIESNDFSFIDNFYNFTNTSHSYLIQLVNKQNEMVESTDFTPIIAIPSDDFTYLGLKYQGAYSRFYPYPKSDIINGFGAYLENDFCYFILSDSGFYQTVYENEAMSSVSLVIEPSDTDDINLSLYQAQFILPRDLLPLGVSQITLEKISSSFLAEYDLKLSDFPVSFNMVLNNPGQDLYPILYIPVGPDLDSANLVVKQILPNGSQLIFHYDEELNNPDQYTIFGNCIILLVNNQGRFIIEKNVGEN